MKTPQTVVARLGGLVAAVVVGLVTTVVPAHAQTTHAGSATSVGSTQKDTGWDEP